MTIQVIGLSGHAGSGKDYIAKNILDPMGYKQFSLAWHFKVGLVGEGKATHDETFVTKPNHVRHMLQQKGTEEGRNMYGDDVWLRHATEWMTILSKMWGINKFVIADVRFPNEVEYIRNMGGKVYRIIAPQRELWSPLTLEQRQHLSETALDSYVDFDGYFFNDPQFEKTLINAVHEQIKTI